MLFDQVICHAALATDAVCFMVGSVHFQCSLKTDMALFTHNQDSDVQACGVGSLEDVNLVCVNEGKGIEQLGIKASNTTKKNPLMISIFK